jgi:hypothetical protein
MGREVIAPVVLRLDTRWCLRSASRNVSFTPAERTPGADQIGVGLTAAGPSGRAV